jgi:hypothetical protein
VVAWLDEHGHRKSIEQIKRVLRWLSVQLRGKAPASITDEAIRLVAKARREQPVNARETTRAVATDRPPPEPKQTSAATVNRHLAQLSAVLQLEMKAGRTHSVPLNRDALLLLAGQRGKHKPWVFPVPRWETDNTGEARQVEDAPTGKVSNHAWCKACVRAGLPTLRFHDLRHAWASWAVQAGTPLPQLGGWASLPWCSGTRTWAAATWPRGPGTLGAVAQLRHNCCAKVPMKKAPKGLFTREIRWGG